MDFKSGAECTKDGTHFKVFAPFARKAAVRLFESDISDDFEEIPFSRFDRGCFELHLNRNLHGKYYAYAIDGVQTIDPYAKSGGANSERGLIFEQGSADPDGWEEDDFRPSTSPVVWEVHVRDFSSDRRLQIDDFGKYTAFRSGVRTPAGNPALVDYLKELGVTHVQLLPVADFGSVDELSDGYNWGYDPMCYFMPEGSYSSNPHDGFARVRELKQLVLNLHRAGIGVVMDVVFNHTYTKLSNALDICARDYYYRMQCGQPCNGSGCGNETRSESVMFRQLMTDCVTYFAKEYHIDGFRFDLMGLHDVDTMNHIRHALDNLYPDGRGKNILTYGEPWYWQPPFEVVGADKQHYMLLDSRIGMFNDVARDGVRGCNSAKSCGLAQGNAEALDAVLGGVSAMLYGNAMKVKSPTQQVVYADCHDNYTLFDQLRLTAGKGADVERMQRMAGFIVLSSLGLPFLHAGDEFLRTKGGDCNSYKSGDKVNMIDWSRVDKHWDCVQYFKGLIQIRQSNPVFCDLATSQQRFCLYKAEDGALAYSVGDILYVVNASDAPVTVPLPEGKTAVRLADIHRAGTESLGIDQEAVCEAHGVYAARLQDAYEQ